MSSLCCDAVLEAVQTSIFKGFEVEVRRTPFSSSCKALFYSD